MEYKVEINGDSYDMDELFSASIEQALFEKFSAGNACSAELTLRLLPHGTIARMATIVPYARESSTDTWTQLGVFYLDTRATESGLMEITAYDAMLKSEVIWDPDQTLVFPMKMTAAVNLFCEMMGVELDSRTALNADYEIDYPANDYTIRDILRYIAAANGGNWCITPEGKLRLVPLFAAQNETTHSVGQKVSRFESYSAVGPISGIALVLDMENEYRAGADTGYVMEVQCPYGTQGMANALLTAFGGKTYYGYRAQDAELAADAELGDGITVNGVSSMLAYRRVNFGPGHFSEIAAPGENEVDHEYPYLSQEQRDIRKAASGYSRISKDVDEIALEVQGKTDKGDVNSLIKAGLEGIEISSSMSGVEGDNSCRIVLKSTTGDIVFETSGVVQMGNVTADSISASKITAGTLDSAVINLDGELNVGIVDDSGTFTSYGYVGAAYGSDAGDNQTYGAMLSSADGNSYVIVTNAGVRLQSGSNRVVVTGNNISLTTGSGQVLINGVPAGRAVFG